jgi:hypothetical protein
MALRAFDKVAVPMLPIDDPDATLLDVPYISQQPYANLCWAACCAMIFLYRKTNIPLCQLASEACNQQCCPKPSSKVCDRTHWPEDTFCNHRFDCIHGDFPLTLAHILYEINAKRPVCAVLRWFGPYGNDDSTHMIVISGYYPNGDLLVMDPLNGEGRLGYHYVEAAYGFGRWSESYYNLTPKNGASA